MGSRRRWTKLDADRVTDGTLTTAPCREKTPPPPLTSAIDGGRSFSVPITPGAAEYPVADDYQAAAVWWSATVALYVSITLAMVLVFLFMFLVETLPCFFWGNGDYCFVFGN